MISVKEARKQILQEAAILGTEILSIHEAAGRVIAQDLVADRDYPPFNRSMMDGYAIRSSDFNEKNIRSFQVLEVLQAGAVASNFIESGTCIKIMTGAPVPKEADAVIRVEDALETNGFVSFSIDKIASWQSIAQQGQDASQNQIILPKGSRLRAPELGLSAVLGLGKLDVYKKPTFALLSTGDELVPPGDPILAYQIRDSNSFALKALFDQYDLELVKRAIVKDKKDDLRAAIAQSSAADILVLSGGVSMGDADFVPEILLESGYERIFHKVKIKPGKPIWFGRNNKGGVVFALPGNPVSCQVAFKVFIEPYLRACLGLNPDCRQYLPLVNSKKKGSRFDQYFSCRFDPSNSGGLLVDRSNSSGDIKATAATHGIALHPADSDDLEAGTILEFYPWNTYF